MLPGIASSLGNQFCPVQGECIYCCCNFNNSYCWSVPPNVRNVSIVMVGAGGGGAGGGGSLQYVNKVIVNPGTCIPITVGTSGGTCGLPTCFGPYYACGGQGVGSAFAVTCPGNGQGGALGGCIGGSNSYGVPGGGGAGGYVCRGGCGGFGSTVGFPGDAGLCGSPAGGGGGHVCNAGGGGGIGLYGCFGSGLYSGASSYGGGKGGSKGQDGSKAVGGQMSGGCWGGGGGGLYTGISTDGAPGAIRIVWSNIKCVAFPACNINDKLTFCNVPPKPTQGQIQYTSAGAYTWIVPAGVYKISAVVVGGGGGAGYSGGGGGSLAYANEIPVIPGQPISICVGSAGTGVTFGGQSWICSSLTSGYWIAAGGGTAGCCCAGVGISLGGGGGAAGYPDPGPWPPYFSATYGSGGSAQYYAYISGGGGNASACTTGTYYSGGMLGGRGGCASICPASCSSGITAGCSGVFGSAGGGAGGHSFTVNCCQNSAYGGGGVGLCGRICNGTGGPARAGSCNVPTQCGGSYPVGGSCGSNYGFISSTAPAYTQAGSVGGGAGGACLPSCTLAGNGGVRIVWSNLVCRVFPTCNVGCLTAL